jgi:hypothetical protein
MQTAPSIYRPQPLPKVLQMKSAMPPPRVPPAPPGPVTPRAIQTHRQPAPNNRPAPAAAPPPAARRPPHQNVRSHAPAKVVQRALDINTIYDDVVLIILSVLGMRIGAEGRPAIMNFALTSKRMHRIAFSQDLPLTHANEMFTSHCIPAILQNYAHTLEPLLHGAHLGVERLGLPGSGTILGLALNGRLIPWDAIPEDFQNQQGNLKIHDWEENVKSKVKKYSELSILARPDREYIQKLEISPKQKKEMQKESKTITKARKHSPAATFQVFLLMNRTLSYPAQFEGKVLSWLDKRAFTLGRLLFGSEIEEYEELGMTEEEEKSCGHSEQLMLMTSAWENIRFQFFHLAEIKMEDPHEWIQPQQVALMLNRSPCSSCGRFLVAELVSFWEALAEYVGMAVDLCRARFQRLFIFRLGYAVKYGKQGIPKHFYPNFTILAALTKAGWLLEKLPKVESAQRQPDACFDTATLSSLKRKPVNLKKIKIQQVESDEDYSYSGQSESESSDEDRRQPPKKKPKKGK